MRRSTQLRGPFLSMVPIPWQGGRAKDSSSLGSLAPELLPARIRSLGRIQGRRGTFVRAPAPGPVPDSQGCSTLQCWHASQDLPEDVVWGQDYFPARWERDSYSPSNGRRADRSMKCEEQEADAEWRCSMKWDWWETSTHFAFNGFRRHGPPNLSG